MHLNKATKHEINHQIKGHYKIVLKIAHKETKNIR
jgi:hypothetical protein